VSDERHDEIAARLRDEAGARAPDGLRADVMLRVAAEPRPRRIRPRRRPWAAAGSIAAAACVLAALVFGLSHTSISGSGSGASDGAGGGTAVHGVAAAPLQAASGAEAAHERSLVPNRSSGVHVNDVPSRATGTVFGRDYGPASPGLLGKQAILRPFNLPPPLARALENLLLDRGRGAH
jgi:negative regulator of sigma E activity